jgi:hypothetical protein
MLSGPRSWSSLVARPATSSTGCDIKAQAQRRLQRGVNVSVTRWN